MFPVGDDDSQRRTTPVVTFALIGLNVLFFLVELSGGDRFIEQWAFVPARFSQDPIEGTVTIFTAMFMHGSWFHLFGNMLFLWIFGDNVEDRMGRFRFVLFYLACGWVATLAHGFLNPSSTVPSIGASGGYSHGESLMGGSAGMLSYSVNAQVRLPLAFTLSVSSSAQRATLDLSDLWATEGSWFSYTDVSVVRPLRTGASVSPKNGTWNMRRVLKNLLK